MLLWAGEPRAAPRAADVVLWQGVPQQESVRSLAEFIEARAEQVRSRYLAWAHNFGDTQVAGRPLRQRFRFAQGASLWAHSVFVEQSTWRQRSLETLPRILALELLLDEERPKEVCLAGGDRAVRAVVHAVCRQRGINYREVGPPGGRVASRGLASVVPHVVRGAVTWGGWGLRWWGMFGGRSRGAAAGVARSALIC